ncbi:MAG: hypothetical protein AB8I08_34040 [Sandaracinaceae bacterium]
MLGLVVSLGLPCLALAQESAAATPDADTEEQQSPESQSPESQSPESQSPEHAGPDLATAPDATAAESETAEAGLGELDGRPEAPSRAASESPEIHGGAQLTAPSRADRPLQLDLDDERPPSHAPAPVRPAPPPRPTDSRPRDWRYPRRRSQRPVTLPQGALRLQNSKSVSYLGRGAMNFQFNLAAGLHDDFEIGAAPLGLTIVNILPAPHDPEVYARVRVLSGPIQLAFRSNVVFPLVSRNTQWGLTAELAWIAEDWLRLDTGLDYQMLFDQPFQQRVGVPVALTLQAGINAFTLTSAVYVFNDFDDVDVPLLARYSVAFGGHQGPVAELGIEGGFLDVIPNPDVAWTARATVTWFAYFGRP